MMCGCVWLFGFRTIRNLVRVCPAILALNNLTLNPEKLQASIKPKPLKPQTPNPKALTLVLPSNTLALTFTIPSTNCY